MDGLGSGRAPERAIRCFSSPTDTDIDARVRAAMAGTRANGMAIAVIDDGRVALRLRLQRQHGNVRLQRAC
jgi:hypothetical protein